MIVGEELHLDEVNKMLRNRARFRPFGPKYDVNRTALRHLDSSGAVRAMPADWEKPMHQLLRKLTGGNRRSIG